MLRIYGKVVEWKISNFKHIVGNETRSLMNRILAAVSMLTHTSAFRERRAKELQSGQLLQPEKPCDRWERTKNWAFASLYHMED